MSGISPASVLFSSDGYELAVIPGSAIPANTRNLIIAGSDGTNARSMLVDSSGRPVYVGAGTAGSPVGGVLSIQGVGGGTPIPISGSVTASNAAVGSTGSTAPTSASLDGALVVTSTPGPYTAGNMQALTITASGLLRIDGTGPTGVAGPADAMYVAGAVTTAAPTYTTGQMNALSLNTAGGLRLDGVSATAATTGSTAMLNGGAVTTAAPSYTTGQMDPLSLTTSGGLRIDGVFATAATTPSTAMLSGGAVTTAAPSYTTGQMDPLSLTTGGLLRIDGVYPVNATTPTSDATFVAGAVTTAAPSYTTGQMSALSLDTSGNLRALVIGSGSAGTPATGVVTVQGISGGTRIPVVTDNSSTGTITSVAAAVTSTQLLASNSNRVSATFFNDTTSSTLYIALAGSASTSAYTVKVLAGSYWELPVSYTGAIYGIWNSASGNVRITELT